MSYLNINAVLNEIATNSSRTYKTHVLSEYRENRLLQTVIKLTLDPLINFYIRKIPIYVPSTSATVTLPQVLPSLERIFNREVTGNAAIELLRSILSSLSSDDASVIERIIQKDLKCGVSTATVNSIWKGLIHDYPVMLCSAFDDKLAAKIKYPAIVQLKMDGMRFNVIVRNGCCEYRSRNGKELELHGTLDADFVTMAKGKNVVFDGELMIKFPNAAIHNQGVFAERKIGNGILSKATKGTLSNEEACMIYATVWDMIPFDDFQREVCRTPYHMRLSHLIDALLPASITRVALVEHHTVQSFEAAMQYFDTYLAQGQEGIIIKDRAGIWENKRAKHQMKCKGELECDLLVTDVLDGTGKYAGMLGAISCQSRDGVIKVDVGSGFNDEQRTTLKNNIIGKIVSIKYNARITDKKGQHSLFLPIFIEVRDDKTTADSSSEVK
jgi:ATP-dependent DNA ligase